MRRQTAVRLYHKDGILMCQLGDAAFNGGSEDNPSDEIGAKDIPVFMPPGLSIDFGKGSKFKASGFLIASGGRDFFFINPNVRTEDNDSEVFLEDHKGTLLYHMQNALIKIVLNGDEIRISRGEDVNLILTDETIHAKVKDAEILLENDSPISLKAAGVSLADAMKELISELADAKTFGSPTNHKFMPDFVAKLKLMQAQKFDKVLK